MATAQATHEPSAGFPSKGSLRRAPFPKLIREVARAKLDGSLYLLSGQTKKVVFFREGQPVFVRSNVLSECLGQILAQEGLITQEQCEQTLEAIRRTGKKQGELLVEMGILSEGNLRYGLEAQLRAKLFEIFSWEEGRYQFKNDPPASNFGVTLKTSAEGVIVEAIQDQYTEDRAAETLESVSGKYPVLLEDVLAAADPLLLPEERFFISCLDGSRTIRELIETESDPPIPTPRALLCGLLLAGLIKLEDEAQPRADWPSAPDLSPPGGSDDDLRPSFEAQARITEYEDTPLPGELPQSPGLLGDHEDDFEGVGEDSAVVRIGDVVRNAEVAEDLVAAEPEGIEETFDDDQIELVDDLDADDDLEPLAPPLLGDDPALAAEPEPAAPPMMEEPPSLDDAPPLMAEPAAVEPPPALGPDEPFSEDFAAGFDSDLPTSLDPPPSAVPEPVTPGNTMPTPEEPAMEPPPMVAEPADVAAPVDAPVEPDVSENDLLDLSPDDDLLMADLNVEAVAMDLLGEGAPPSPVPDLVASPAAVDPALESIDPVTLDPDGFADEGFDPASLDADEEMLDEDVLEVEPDDLELDELDEEDFAEDVAAVAQSAPAPAPAAAAGDDALLDFADLDDIDLGGDDPGIDAGAAEYEEESDEDVLGALRFNEGQAALSEERWADAVALLEEAYEGGFDVAELHAMLAYGRFQASGQDDQTAQHAFELLDYAQQMDPSLDLTHAYRGAIHRARGDIPEAREALDRALELNPYCELAMELLDAIG